jgi:hypothetical protein
MDIGIMNSLDLTVEDPPKLCLEDQITQLIVHIGEVTTRKTGSEVGAMCDDFGKATELLCRLHKLRDEATALRDTVDYPLPF